MERKRVDGKLTGTHYQKQLRLAMNVYTVDARRGSKDNEKVSRQHSSALHFATMVDFVLKTKNYTSLMVIYLIHEVILLIAGFYVYHKISQVWKCRVSHQNQYCTCRWFGTWDIIKNPNRWRPFAKKPAIGNIVEICNGPVAKSRS